MEIVFSPGSVVLVSLVTGGWAALLCLKALGAELDYQRRLAKLMREARELRQAQEERRRRLHKSTMERLRPRIIAPAPVESDSPAEAQPETIGRVDPVAAPPLAQAA